MEQEPNTTPEQAPAQPPVAPAPVEQPVSVLPQDQEAPTGAAPVAVGAPVVKRKKKWLLPVIIAAVLVLLGGGAAAYYFMVYQNPQNVLYDAYKSVATAKMMQAKGTIKVDTPATLGVKITSVEYGMDGDQDAMAGQMNVMVHAEVSGEDIAVGGKGMFDADGNLYFQLNGLVDAFRSVMKSSSSSSSVPDSFYDALGKMQDQWVKVTMSDLKDANATAAKTYQCMLDVTKKHKNDSDKPYLEAYKNNTFITKKEDLGTKDGKIGYTLNYDEAKAKAFYDAISELPVAKELSDCSKANGNTYNNSTSTVDKSSVDNTTFTVWVDQWSHQLKTVEYSTSTKSGGVTASANGSVNIAYDKNVKVTAPGSTISFTEYKNRYDDLATELGMPSSKSLRKH